MKKLLLTAAMIMSASFANASGNMDKVCDKAKAGSIAAAKIIAMQDYVCNNGYISNAIVEKQPNKDFVIESFYKSSSRFYRAELTVYNKKIKRIKCRAMNENTVVGAEELYIFDKWETMIIMVNSRAKTVTCNAYY